MKKYIIFIIFLFLFGCITSQQASREDDTILRTIYQDKIKGDWRVIVKKSGLGVFFKTTIVSALENDTLEFSINGLPPKTVYCYLKAIPLAIQMP